MDEYFEVYTSESYLAPYTSVVGHVVLVKAIQSNT